MFLSTLSRSARAAFSVVALGTAAWCADGVATIWDNAALEAIRTVRPGPPMVARALNVVATSMYDAWAAYDDRAMGTQLGAQLRRPTAERGNVTLESKAISFAAYRALVDLFPSQVAELNTVMFGLGYDPADHSVDPASPAGVGNLAAAAVIDYRHHDGANQLGDLSPSHVPYADYTGYAPLNPAITVATPTLRSMIPVPGRWQPVSYVNPDTGTMVTPNLVAPFWGNVRPFALTSSSQFRPAPPAAWNSFFARLQIAEVIWISAHLTDKQKCIAEYWADGPTSETPAGHWNLFAQFVARRDGMTLDQEVKMYFALNGALLDASIATWEAKRHYDYWRPISAIRYIMSGKTITAWGGPGLDAVSMPGEQWRPFQKDSFPTPPFSEYTSGHSAFSAAAAEVLKRFTHSDRFGTGVTIAAHSLQAEPTSPASPVTLKWQTFSQAANEAGISRRYGGIHFIQGDVVGRLLGRKVGAQAYKLAEEFWKGGGWHHAPISDG